MCYIQDNAPSHWGSIKSPGTFRAPNADAAYSWRERDRSGTTSGKPSAVGSVPASYEVPHVSIKMLPCSVRCWTERVSATLWPKTPYSL